MDLFSHEHEEYIKNSKVVVCSVCGCLAWESMAKRFNRKDGLGWDWFCKKDKPPYDRVEGYGNTLKFFKDDVQVDANGKPTNQTAK